MTELATSRVQMPNAFFAKSKLEYNNWRQAFFRELIQNLGDAGADRADFIFTQDQADPELLCVTIADNGCGMNRDVLVNTLLCLGGSLKREGAVGGFGYAKSLLFFAHEKYSIQSQGCIVHGSGGEYTIQEVSNSAPGTYINVWMRGENMTLMGAELSSYVSYMYIDRPIVITLNGERLDSTFTDFDFKVRTQIGSLLFKDIKGNKSRLVIAVKGLPMFVHQVYTNGTDAFDGILNIEGDSREMLTANRDSLKGSWASGLTDLVQRMLDERFKFKLGETIEMTLNYTNPKTVVGEAPVGFDVNAVDAACALRSASRVEQNYGTFHQTNNDFRFLENTTFPHNFNIRIQNTVARKTADRAVETIGVSQVISLMKKGWVQRLAVSWKLIVWEILRSELMQEAGVLAVEHVNGVLEFYFQERRIAAGFIFAHATEGMNIKSDDEVLILCNPQIWTKSFTYPDLCDLALHECTHLFASGHNDHFNDLEMKIRRSLRLQRDEAELTAFVKRGVNRWRDEEVQT